MFICTNQQIIQYDCESKTTVKEGIGKEFIERKEMAEGEVEGEKKQP